MQLRHTSEATVAQVYVPGMSMILLAGVVITVLGFRSSDALGGAYGIAVTGTMTVDTILAFTFFRLGARRERAGRPAAQHEAQQGAS
jgi:KUP system potassium uptake protein